MGRKKVLVTGAGGLIGSEAVCFFAEKDWDVIGVDNNMRQYFFGEKGSVLWNLDLLTKKYSVFQHRSLDVRDQVAIEELFREHTFDLIIHAAAQPSHDWALKEPVTDFTVNANGTLTLLEAARNFCKDAVFIFTSTNKVYGDLPNTLPFVEKKTRYELPGDHIYYNGITEQMSIDQCKHSLFGVSKVAADVLVQEYGRYFGMRTAVFRGGCLTGSMHSGVALHGFLSYLVKSIVHEIPYTIHGYNGKQVRDNIHAHDVITAFYEFYKAPKAGGQVYNIGGTRFSNISMCEAIECVEGISGKKANVTYSQTAREGDHMWYITSMKKFKHDYPAWKHTVSLERMLTDMCKRELAKG